jgi:hypothetical protein
MRIKCGDVLLISSLVWLGVGSWDAVEDITMDGSKVGASRQ